ncbi:hypothetical protein COOONC_02249, partial [Cooperia oncophora]
DSPDEVEILEYRELGFEPLLRMIASEKAQAELQQHHYEEHHDDDHRRESRQYDEDYRRESHNHHRNDSDEEFTFEDVEYVHERDDAAHLHDSDMRKHEYEAYHEPERRQSSNDRIITTATTTTTNKLYDPYASPVETRRHDDVSEELIKHVVEPMIREIMRDTVLTDNSAHFYEYTPTSTSHTHQMNTGVRSNDQSYYTRSVYDKDHHHHRESPLLVDTSLRRDTNEVEIRTRMHSSGHSTLVRHSQRPNVDLPPNSGVVKQLLQKLETGQYNDERREKPHKEINIFESLDDNGNYKEHVLPPVPVSETHYHQFHELRYQEPRKVSKNTANLHHYEHKDHNEAHHHDSDVEHQQQHVTKKTEARVEHVHDRRHDEVAHDHYHNHQHSEDYHRGEYHDDRHHHERRADHRHKHHDEHQRHEHRDYRTEVYDDRHHHKHQHEHDHHHDHHHDRHHDHHHKQAEYVYEPSEYSVESVDENQLSVSELTNVFGGAVKLRKPDNVEEHKTHKRTTSIHRIDEVVHTTTVGGNVVDTRSQVVSTHAYQPQARAGPPTEQYKASPVHHYTPQPVQPHNIPAVLPKAAPAVDPVTVARMPRKENADKFNSIRVVRNVRDFVNVYGRKDFDSTEVISSPLSPRSPVVPTVQEQKVAAPVQALPRTNVAETHQQVQHVQKKQTVVKTDVQHYPKVEATVQQRTVTHVSTSHVPALSAPLPVAPVQVPVPAKREMHLTAQSPTSPIQLPSYHAAVVPCCCCSHLMHVQPHYHAPALVHGTHYVAPMLPYNNLDIHHTGHQHEHDMHHQHAHHHVGMDHEHHLHQHEYHKGDAHSDKPFKLVPVSQRRAAYEQMSTETAYSNTQEGPKPMIDIFSD